MGEIRKSGDLERELGGLVKLRLTRGEETGVTKVLHFDARLLAYTERQMHEQRIDRVEFLNIFDGAAIATWRHEEN